MGKKAELLLAPCRKELLVPRGEPPHGGTLTLLREGAASALQLCVVLGACSTQLTTMDQRELHWRTDGSQVASEHLRMPRVENGEGMTVCQTLALPKAQESRKGCVFHHLLAWHHSGHVDSPTPRGTKGKKI